MDADCFSAYRIQNNLFLEGNAEQNYQLFFPKYLAYSTAGFNFENVVSNLSLEFGILP